MVGWGGGSETALVEFSCPSGLMRYFVLCHISNFWWCFWKLSHHFATKRNIEDSLWESGNFFFFFFYSARRRSSKAIWMWPWTTWPTPCFCTGDRPHDLQKYLPTSTVLWFSHDNIAYIYLFIVLKIWFTWLPLLLHCLLDCMSSPPWNSDSFVTKSLRPLGWLIPTDMGLLINCNRYFLCFCIGRSETLLHFLIF